MERHSYEHAAYPARIRPCTDQDLGAILSIINDAATAYQGAVAAECLGDPYMTKEALRHEIAEGVRFWGADEGGRLVGVMGIEDLAEVTLIRHAYVRTDRRDEGLGGRLLEHLLTLTDRPVLVGTWRAATWAIGFYERRGFRLAPPEEKDRLLEAYWSVPKLQAAHSVVLLDDRALAAGIVPIYELVAVDAQGVESEVLRRGPGPWGPFSAEAAAGARAGTSHRVYRLFRGHRSVWEEYTVEDMAAE